MCKKIDKHQGYIAAMTLKDACSLEKKLWATLTAYLKKGRDLTLPAKGRLVKPMVFPVVMYGCESWTIKKAEWGRIDAFELRCWRRLLRIPWTAKRSNQSILKKSALYIHWKDWCRSWNSNPLATRFEELTYWIRHLCCERLKVGGEGDDRGWDGGWHHQLNGHEFEQALGVGDGQGRLACCSPWGCKESVTTEQLNWSCNFSNAKEEWLNVNKSYLCCFHIHSSVSVQVLKDIFCLWLKLQNNFNLVDRVVFAKKLCKNDLPGKAFSYCVSSALCIFFN